MRKIKLKIAWLLGMSIAKLENHPTASMMAKFFRESYPGLWAVLAKKARPFYWIYQTSTFDDSADAAFKELSAFHEQQWKDRLSRKLTNNAYSIEDGIRNNRPVVEAAAILERIKINRAAASRKQ